MQWNAGFKFIIAVPICSTLDETWRVIDDYIKLKPGGFMVGVGGRLPVIAPEGQRDLVDYGKLCEFVAKLKARYPKGIIAVDAEGGDIFNVLRGSSPLRGARHYSAPTLQRRQEELAADLESHASMLQDAGVHMNFAPLLDVPLSGYRGYAAEDGRCVSDEAAEVESFARMFLAAHRRHGIVCTAKHFPGYGHLTENPHRTLSDEAGSWNADTALAPYRGLIAGGDLQAVMLGHSTTPAHPQVPATLAQGALTLLREKLGFDGIAVADELFMGAVNDYYRNPVSGSSDGDPNGVRRAVDAWKLNDLIIVSYPIQNRDGTVTGIPGGETRLSRMTEAVHRAFEEGHIQREHWEPSMRRIAAVGLPS